MGVVYLATDTRLDRQVAIKALPVELASDPARLERFEREAKTLAQLNHPNLAGIHGVEEQDGARYLVLEYVDGESLADALDHGRLAVDQAIELAMQIAAGIEAAHDAGVIHRDLKPANVMITTEGQAKVLDFGLARTDDDSQSRTSAHDSPTITQPQNSPTIAGAILGTAAYMSPEQARGRRVDKRTDIWSFGVVLYEMLVGASPFHGETPTDSIGAVLHKDVDLALLPAHTPTNIRRVLQRCLVRDKSLRYRDIGDVRLELGSDSDGDEHTTPVARPRSGARTLGLGVAVALLAAVGGVFLGRELFIPPPPETRPISLAIDLEGRYELHRRPQPVFSSDGQRVLLSVKRDGSRHVVVRDLTTDGFTELDTGESHSLIGFSPNSEWVFFDDGDGRLRKAPLDGGPPVTICDLTYMNGGTWTEADEILFVPQWRESVHRVAASGGTSEPLYEKTEFGGLSPNQYVDGYPRVMPGGRWVVFQRSLSPNWDDTLIMIVSIDGGEPRELMRIGAHPRFLASGHMVFQREGTLMVVAIDAEQGRVVSSEVSVLRGLDGSEHWFPATFDLTEGGDLIHIAAPSEAATSEVGTMSLAGEWRSLGLEFDANSSLAISDDGSRLAIRSLDDGRSKVSEMELARGITRPIPGGRERDIDGVPVWYPDHTTMMIAYRDAQGEWSIGRHRIGTPTTDLMTYGRASFKRLDPRQISSDGHTLFAVGWSEDIEVLGLHAIPLTDTEILADDPSTKKIINPKYRPGCIRLSPDDRWIAYDERSMDQSEVLVASVADPSKVVQVSVGGGTRMTWATDSNRLYYLNDRESPMVIRAVDYSVTEEGNIVPEPPEVLFELEGTDDVGLFDMTADGTGFYLSRSMKVDSQAGPQLPQVVIGWSELVRDVLVPRSLTGP